MGLPVPYYSLPFLLRLDAKTVRAIAEIFDIMLHQLNQIYRHDNNSREDFREADEIAERKALMQRARPSAVSKRPRARPRRRIRIPPSPPNLTTNN